MQIELDRSSSQPLYQQLASCFQQRIRSGALPTGTRLPTVRQLAQQLGITRLTAHSAYAELQAGGWVEATVGRGTFVAQQEDMMRTSLASMLGQEVTPRGVLDDILRMAQMPGLRSLAMSDPLAEGFPLREWQRATEEALAIGGPQVMGYATAQGDLALRAALATMLHERGMTIGPDEIMITSGATQGVALAAELLARPGDIVLVEQPTYLGVLNIAMARGLRTIGLPTDQEGLRIDALEQELKRARPAFLYIIPTYHNPTGVCLSPQRRAALMDLAARYQLPIVEDDIYGRMGYEGVPPPALKANDRHGLVLHVGSFSKSLMPALRMGYLVATPALIKQAVTARQAMDMCSSLLTQRALAIFLERGWHTAHIRRSLPHYRERRDAMLRAMERHFPAGVFWTRPQGGFSCWVALPIRCSVTELYLAAIDRGVAFAPGDVFCVNPPARPHMRLSFSTHSPARIVEAIATIGDLLREHSSWRALPLPVSGDCIPLV